MPTVVLPRSIHEKFFQKWQGELKSIGYSVAYRPEEYILVVLLTAKTGTGTPEHVEKENLHALGRLDVFIRDLNYDLLPTLSHPIQGISPEDRNTLDTLARFEYHNSIFIEPSTIRSYHVPQPGLLYINPVAVVEDERLREKFETELLQIWEILELKN